MQSDIPKEDTIVQHKRSEGLTSTLNRGPRMRRPLRAINASFGPARGTHVYQWLAARVRAILNPGRATPAKSSYRKVGNTGRIDGGSSSETPLRPNNKRQTF